MSGRIDDSAVALTAYYGIGLLHLGHHVDLAHCGCIVLLAVLAGYITQSASAAEIAHGIAWSVLQDVVGHCNEGIFLAVHSAVLAEESQAVNVGIDHKTYILTALLHERLDISQILLKRFGIVLEVACRLGEEARNVLHTQLLEELGQDDAAHAVD